MTRIAAGIQRLLFVKIKNSELLAPRNLVSTASGGLTRVLLAKAEPVLGGKSPKIITSELMCH